MSLKTNLRQTTGATILYVCRFIRDTFGKKKIAEIGIGCAAVLQLPVG